MTHFFANPLSVLLSDNLGSDNFQPELCEAIRNVPSFRRYDTIRYCLLLTMYWTLTRFRRIESLLEDNDTKQSRKFLDDDNFLTLEVKSSISDGLRKIDRMFQSMKIITDISNLLKAEQAITMSEMIIRAFAGDLQGSAVIGDTLSAIQKLPSNEIQDLLAILPDDFVELKEDFQSLFKDTGQEPLRSKYDNSRFTHKTTIVGQTVKLTKGMKKLSKQDLNYTALVDRLVSSLDIYFAENFITPQDLFMCEAFVYDLRTPIKDVFAPRPRFAIERALSSPSDYLVTSSSIVAQNLSVSQPVTAILYQLYLESGSLVNIYDLWKAFYTIISSGNSGENCSERHVLTLFYHALSELKMMGMLKHSRKKIDHLAKANWMGL